MNRMQSGRAQKNIKTEKQINKNNKKTKKKKKRKGKLLIFLIIVIIIGALFGYKVNRNGGGIQGVLATILLQDSEKLENLDTINVLLLRNK